MASREDMFKTQTNAFSDHRVICSVKILTIQIFCTENQTKDVSYNSLTNHRQSTITINTSPKTTPSFSRIRHIQQTAD